MTFILRFEDQPGYGEAMTSDIVPEVLSVVVLRRWDATTPDRMELVTEPLGAFLDRVNLKPWEVPS